MKARSRSLKRRAESGLGAFALGLLLCCAGAACGPVESTAVIWEADAKVAAAKAAGADQLSPYEFHAASSYLTKAREEQGYSDFEISIDYGNKSIELAKRAIANSQKRKGVDAPMPNR